MNSLTRLSQEKVGSPCSMQRRVRVGLRRSSSSPKPFVSPVLQRAENRDELQMCNTPPLKKLKRERVVKHITGIVNVKQDDSAIATCQGNTCIEKTNRTFQVDDHSCNSSVMGKGGAPLGDSSTLHGKEPRGRQTLEKVIDSRKETLRKLQMVKMYRKKNNLQELQTLIDKWRAVSQEAANRLLTQINVEPSPTMSEMLAQFQIDHSLIRYCDDEEGFI